MSSVVFMLGNEGEIPQAKQPGFFTERDVLAGHNSTSTNAGNSTNEVTITMPQPRCSDQLKFWSENVQNKIPKSILKKLSPLSKTDIDYYSNIISKNGNKFSADANFCSHAKLACTSLLNNARTVTNTYTTTKTYPANSASFRRANKNNEDPFSFFRLAILENGNLVHLPNLHESLPDRAFLPPQIASTIPLTYQGITKVFPELSAGVGQETIQTTLSLCEAEEIQGEMKSCPKSLEEMVGFAKFALGGKRLFALSSENTKGSNTVVMIKHVKKYAAEKIVACHEAFLPFAAYFCHSLSSTRLYAVDLVDRETGASVNNMVAICHMDTSPWPENHVAFQILKFGPGEGEACHWFTQIDLAWIGIE
ncbi:hypothetical protein DH2020_049484 [Rehmannia glutinosa]|uniref:BURP domain-containing protein n=1 Tax=Rehmannia glutinosa TaxID=99300 RepID=A0ABR0U2N5_REHGL